MEKTEVWKNFAHISRFMHNRISSRLRGYKLGRGQSEILRFLVHRGDGKSQDEIRRELELDSTTVTRTIQRLIKNGYIVRKKDEKDRRINRIYLTEKAGLVDSIAGSTKKEVLGLLTEGIKREDFEIFSKVLEEMHQNMEKNREETGGE